MEEYKIKIKDKLITVSKEIYITYYKMHRRERYLEEVSLKKNISYNKLIEQGYPIESKMVNSQCLLEDEIIKKCILKKLRLALNELTPQELTIIVELFFYSKSERELAYLIKLPRTTILYRKNKIIKKLRKILEN